MFFLVLITSVCILGFLCWILWKRTHNIAFPFGIAVFYFWSLHGGWSIVTDRLGGDSGKHYHYLYEKVFPVYLDTFYFWTLVGYTTFIAVAVMTTLYLVRPARLPIKNLSPLRLSHTRILVICGIAALFSFWIVHDSLAAAAQAGSSGYAQTRSTTANSWFRLHQVLNRVALLPAALGFASLFARNQARYLTGHARFKHFLGYSVLLGFMFCFCLVLGNKNELAVALFSGALFYLANTVRPRYRGLGLICVVLLSGVAFIDFARGLAMTDITQEVTVLGVASSLLKLTNSNESFGAHISLYGVLYYDIPLTYGSSISSFLASAIPRVFWPSRPPDIYWHYATGVSAVEGQGYSIHHAAGWYLNFGVAGLLAGAVLLGSVWAGLYNNLCHRAHLLQRPIWWRLFCIVGFFTFTGNLPNLIRAGPEGYKSILIDSFMVPIMVLVLARVARSKLVKRRGIKSKQLVAPRLASQRPIS